MAALKNPKRSGAQSYSAKPHHIFRPNFATETPSPASVLGHAASHLLDNLVSQFNGKNNGDLSLAPKIMSLYGWNSKGAIEKAKIELLALGFIEQTRQGGRNRCSLFAITWLAIDDCKGKLDVRSTSVPSNLWKPENADKRDQRFVEAFRKLKRVPTMRGSVPAMRGSVPAMRGT